ncbi:endo-1,4-beta-xylanase [Candidatus Symbiothrix dinenymphae]|nr:endo-1,4-beta-xylanase [Candidatus Symbiothrix dinenymphae]
MMKMMKRNYWMLAFFVLVAGGNLLAQQKNFVEGAKNNRIVANPLDLVYRFRPQDNYPARREAADPVCEYFKGKYYLFASKSGGYWSSPDLANWTYIPCTTISIIEDYAPTVLALGDTLYYIASAKTTIYYTTNPDKDEWRVLENSQYEFGDTDPALFHDEETGRVYLYYGCSNRSPIRGVELLPSQGFKSASEPVAVIDHHTELYGWEIPGEKNEKDEIGWNEGASMLKYKGKYYLQYASPGTQFRIYADGVYVGDSPLGPFKYVESNPFSIKPGGFIGGAGHGHTFQDKYGNYWHVATMKISIRHDFERRIGLFPVYFDEQGDMHAHTLWTDYPFVIPDRKTDFEKTNLSAGWHILSYHKKATASSLSENAASAFDEHIESMWAAATGNSGEWLQIDLGEKKRINAIQVNFADVGFTIRAPHAPFNYQYYIEASDDAEHWTRIIDRTDNVKDAVHELLVLKKPLKSRYLRITNTKDLPGKFSLYDFRVFGKGTGKKPQQITGLTIRRNEADPRRYSLSWDKQPNADGYIVNVSLPDGKTNQSIMVYDNQYEGGIFNRDSEYRFSVDAFNENGITKGK